jgi:hypothetical protein
MATVDATLASSVTNIYLGAGINYSVVTNSGVWYVIYFDQNNDVAFVKSSDYGASWSDPTIIFAGTATNLAVWYDRWSDISGDIIHCAYVESVTDDVLYRNIDTASSDTLSTQTTIFAGLSQANGGYLAITRARGGNLVCIYSIDAGAEDGTAKSTDVGATWGATIADATENATQDQAILVPGWNADTQDVMAFFWDASANEISVKRYDDSANTWTETSIATSMTDTIATTSFPHFAAAVDITNSQNLLVAWSAVDTANADLRCWKINDTTITEVTNVVLNSTDDQGLAAIGIDTATQDWYVFYSGKSDGSETVSTSVNIYYKVSTDDGTNWGSETKLTNKTYSIPYLQTSPRFDTKFCTVWYNASTIGRMVVSVPVAAAGGLAANPIRGFIS